MEIPKEMVAEPLTREFLDAFIDSLTNGPIHWSYTTDEAGRLIRHNTYADGQVVSQVAFDIAWFRGGVENGDNEHG